MARFEERYDLFIYNTNISFKTNEDPQNYWLREDTTSRIQVHQKEKEAHERCIKRNRIEDITEGRNEYLSSSGARTDTKLASVSHFDRLHLKQTKKRDHVQDLSPDFESLED